MPHLVHAIEAKERSILLVIPVHSPGVGLRILLNLGEEILVRLYERPNEAAFGLHQFDIIQCIHGICCLFFPAELPGKRLSGTPILRVEPDTGLVVEKL